MVVTEIDEISPPLIENKALGAFSWLECIFSAISCARSKRSFCWSLKLFFLQAHQAAGLAWSFSLINLDVVIECSWSKISVNLRSCSKWPQWNNFFVDIADFCRQYEKVLAIRRCSGDQNWRCWVILVMLVSWSSILLRRETWAAVKEDRFRSIAEYISYIFDRRLRLSICSDTNLMYISADFLFPEDRILEGVSITS